MPKPETPVADLQSIRIDGKTGEALEKMALRTISDLLTHYPRRYEDRSRFDIFPEGPMETPVCLLGEVTDCQSRFARGRGRRFFEATIEPAGGGDLLGNRIILRWFNLAYIHKLIVVGQTLVLYGKPKTSGKRLVIDHPDFEIVDGDPDAADAHMGRIVPVYPLVSGISQKPLRTLIHRALETALPEDWPDWLPGESMEVPSSRFEAIRQIHYPESFEALDEARRYLALEEFTRLQVVLQRRRAEHRSEGGRNHLAGSGLLERFLADLPFEPTGAQGRAIEEIQADLGSEAPMVRLLQGDVGAGKTLVAAAAILLVIEAGFDAALMAPTQILAEQHHATFRAWFEPLGIEVRLKTANRDTGEALPLFSSEGQKGTLTVGTHALLHDRSEFENSLGLAVIDEQHKFGVDQREKLIRRGDRPDVLVMTATPIPRTLALSFYGDLDVSVLDERPPGRGRTITGIRLASQTEDAAKFLRDQVAAGRQAYVVYPLIEESEKTAGAAAVAEYDRWKERLPGLRLELLHGRMGPEEKEEVMDRFRRGEADVLVSTTVIEVGVDVPNANVMLIYNAERFGLAQIHQLRGRIGRGEHKSFCVLLLDPEASEARERLSILEQSSDGFRIAEEDLRQRGPGEVLGTQQSGLPALAFVEFLADHELVEQARRIAEEMVAG